MKIVIYTVITGSYDTLRQPFIVDSRFNYICFSNDIIAQNVGIWEIRRFPIVTADPQRLSRYPKIKPHELLGEFDYSVYMDANLVIAKCEFYSEVFRLLNENKIFAGIKNGWRNCLYEEGFRCILSGLDTIPKIIREMRFIKSEKFPAHYGMYEANIIFRKHHDSTIISQSNLWWNMVSDHARRDQLSLSYTLWKCNLPWAYIFQDGTNTHNNPNILFHEHPHKKLPNKKIRIRALLKFLKPILFGLYNLIISINYKR